MAHIAKHLTELIGRTPLLELTNYEKQHGLNAHIIAKLEYFNPLGSVKDRVGNAMIEQGIRDGIIDGDTVLIEPTSGNTGIGLAFAAACRGLHLILTMPETMSVERRKIVHLTSRQGVEIPFVKLQDIDAVKAELAEGGLKPGVCGPRVRTVTACQGNQICPSGNIDTYDIAVKLDERYFGRELPHKFKFGVTGCQNNCLKAEENDVGIKGALDVKWIADKCINCGVCEKACRSNAITIEDGKVNVDYQKCNYCGRCAKSCPTDAWDAKPAYILSFGGTFGNAISKGESPLPLITSEEQLFRVTDAAIQFFADYANPGERFKFTIDRAGREKFEQVIKEAYNG